MSNVVTYKENQSLLDRAKKYGRNVGLAVTGAVLASPAYAVDTTEAVNQIKGITTATDAVGGAFISVAVGMVIFGFIIGMIFRKGR